jgi:hypothetical protein
MVLDTKTRGSKADWGQLPHSAQKLWTKLLARLHIAAQAFDSIE